MKDLKGTADYYMFIQSAEHLGFNLVCDLPEMGPHAPPPRIAHTHEKNGFGNRPT